MYSLIYDFNLSTRGPETERYLLTMMRKWPELYAKVPGVSRDVLFLGNALALSGKYTFRMVVELDSLKTLKTLDEVMKTDRQWQKARMDFIKNRSEVVSHLLYVENGDKDFSAKLNSSTDTVLFMINHGETADQKTLLKRQSTALRKVSGVRSVRSHTPAIRSAGPGGVESWVGVEFDQLEEVSQATRQISVGTANTRLYGVLREVSGAFIASA